VRKRLILGVLFFSVTLCLRGQTVFAQTSPPATIRAKLPLPGDVGASMCQTGLQKDWKKAIWRAPLHILVSAPVAAISFVIPPVGKAYVRVRMQAEERDRSRGTDTCMKAAIDLYSQTALVRAVLRMYGIRVQ
jgi:hypothetical protein